MPFITDPSRDLLFGLLALQNGLIDQDQLVAAFRSWSRDKERSMADHLLNRRDLNNDQCALVEGLVVEHLKRHSGDAAISLAAITLRHSTRDSLSRIGDADVVASLTHVGSPAAQVEDAVDLTVTYTVGTATSEGQRFRVLRPHAQGGLEHPGIVPVYGLGTYRDGRPFYAMRFIRGDSLKEAIERFHKDKTLQANFSGRSLELRKLLRRFLDVCNAIEYAHTRGVLHRDIKPGNIIVGKHGETLVVDWGLAKAQGRGERIESTDERPLIPRSISGATDTQPGSTLGTPAYVSPEQARGDIDALGPSSDVYSLGATLYCLLVGQPPFEGKDVGTLLRDVQRGAFPRPRHVDSRIDRALEAICLKSMATSPTDRYRSAQALAEDLERWIADEPVSAFRDPLAIRLTRWGRRHRSLAASLAVLLVSVVVGLSIGTVLINRERAKAEVNFRQARAAVDDYFTTVSESKLLNVPGLQPLRKDLLDAARRYYREFLRQRGEDSSVRAEAASASFRIGWVADALGERDEAMESYQAATALYEQLTRDHPTDVQYRRFLAIAHGAQGLLLAGMDRVDEALTEHGKALEIRAAILESHPDDPLAVIDVARTHRNIGILYRAIGKPAEALDEWEKAVAIARPLLDTPLSQAAQPVDLTGRNNLSAIIREDLGSILLDQAEALCEAGRKVKSQSSWEQARGLFEGLVREYPDDLSLRARLADCYANGYSLEYDLGHFEEAHQLIQRSLEVREPMAAENPSVLVYRRALAEGLLNLGYIRSLLGRRSEALEAYGRATELAETLLVEEPDKAYTQNLLAQGLSQRASILSQNGQHDQALPLARRASELLESIVRQQPDKIFHTSALTSTLRTLSRVEFALGDKGAALRAYERSAELDGHLADRYPGCRYNQACSLALMISVAEPVRHESLAAQAVATLRQAIAAGYSNVQNVRTDHDLDTLRDRDDFQRLFQDVR